MNPSEGRTRTNTDKHGQTRTSKHVSIRVRPCLSVSVRVRPHAGFTLAELLVATTLLAIVMTAVYTAFGSTLRAWRLGEANLHTFQDARTALSIMSRELNCALGGAEHLFQGKDDEFEFFTVSPPMNVAKGEGARVLWVKYRYNRTGKSLVRQEAIVEKPLPLRPPEGEKVDEGRIKLGRKHKYDLASDSVLGFKVKYYWIPPVERKPDAPPEWIEPIVLDESREDWGLPQGIQVKLTLKDINSESGKTTFTYRMSFRGPTTPYNEKKIGAIGSEGVGS